MSDLPTVSPAPEPGRTSGLSGTLVVLMAVATGAIVANLYYAQPLLHQIGETFHAGATATSLVVTATQAGYAVALVLVLPLGDLHPRRTLVVAVYAIAVATLALCALAPSLWVFELGSVATGLASVAGQIMVPFAADLATPTRRARVVARIMTGLLLGILLARTLAGLVAQFAGWRAIYWVSAALMGLFALVLRAFLPEEHPRPALRYGALVASTLRLFASSALVRRRAAYGSAVFAAFSVLWTTLAFLLAGPPYHYSNLVIGLFGLAGVGGVIAANSVGKLADSGRTGISTAVGSVLTLASFALLAAGRTSLGFLVAGIVVLDAGTQGVHVTNQALIYEAAPQARSRVNSAYMTCYFVGGAVGSVTAGTVLAAAGWDGVCILGAGFAALALGLVALDRWRPLQPQSPVGGAQASWPDAGATGSASTLG